MTEQEFWGRNAPPRSARDELIVRLVRRSSQLHDMAKMPGTTWCALVAQDVDDALAFIRNTPEPSEGLGK